MSKIIKRGRSFWEKMSPRYRENKKAEAQKNNQAQNKQAVDLHALLDFLRYTATKLHSHGASILINDTGSCMIYRTGENMEQVPTIHVDGIERLKDIIRKQKI